MKKWFHDTLTKRGSKNDMGMKNICAAASAILWAAIPSMPANITRTDRFAVVDVWDDCAVAFADSMDLPVILSTEGNTHAVCGPLTDEQVDAINHYPAGGIEIVLPSPDNLDAVTVDGEEAVSMDDMIERAIMDEEVSAGMFAVQGRNADPERASVLAEAHDTVMFDRQDQYGRPEDNFERIALLWSVILRADVSAEQVALCMAALKIARIKEGSYHRDNYVDGAGYFALAAEMAANNTNGETIQ